MDVFPKFIIEGDSLIIGKCTYHKELASDVKNIKGGGWWRWNDDKTAFILHGNSFDFGEAKLEDIQDCIKSGNVYSNRSHAFSIAADHGFFYDIGSELINLKSSTNEQ